MAASKKTSWSAVKKSVSALNAKELIALTQELFDLSAENKAFLAARFAAADPADRLKPYMKRVIEPFYPARGGFGALKFGDARAAIREYEKATSDLRGTLDLMLTFVESGNEFTHEYGDIDAPFYQGIESMLEAMLKRLGADEGRPLFAEFQQRLIHLRKASE